MYINSLPEAHIALADVLTANEEYEEAVRVLRRANDQVSHSAMPCLSLRAVSGMRRLMMYRCLPPLARFYWPTLAFMRLMV